MVHQLHKDSQSHCLFSHALLYTHVEHLSLDRLSLDMLHLLGFIEGLNAPVRILVIPKLVLAKLECNREQQNPQ